MALPTRSSLTTPIVIAGLLAAAITVPAARVQAPAQTTLQAPAQAQTPPQAPAQPRVSPREQVPMDPERARQLYVPTDPQYQSIGTNFERAVEQKAEIDKRYEEVTKGVVDYSKVSYRSPIGDLDIPAYLFQPLDKGEPKSRAAMVWVHGGVHGNWGITMWPFVKEAVDRGYVIIAPEYRGSTGYGEAFHKEIGYNYRLTNMAAALGLSQMEKLSRFLRKRTLITSWYRRRLPGIPVEKIPDGVSWNRWLLSVQTRTPRAKTALLKRLLKAGCQARCLWVPVPRQKPYRQAETTPIPNAQWAYSTVLNIPSATMLTEAHVARVARVLRKADVSRLLI